MSSKRVPPQKKETADAEALKSQGIDNFKAAQYTEAEKCLSRSLEVKPDRDAYLYLIYAQTRLDRGAPLAATLQKSLRDFPEEVRFYRLCAKHLADKGKIEEALIQVEKGLQKHPDDLQLKMLENFLQGEMEGRKKK